MLPLSVSDRPGMAGQPQGDPTGAPSQEQQKHHTQKRHRGKMSSEAAAQHNGSPRLSSRPLNHAASRAADSPPHWEDSGVPGRFVLPSGMQNPCTKLEVIDHTDYIGALAARRRISHVRHRNTLT
jgi:hypothetical protein